MTKISGTGGTPNWNVEPSNESKLVKGKLVMGDKTAKKTSDVAAKSTESTTNKAAPLNLKKISTDSDTPAQTKVEKLKETILGFVAANREEAALNRLAKAEQAYNTFHDAYIQISQPSTEEWDKLNVLSNKLEVATKELESIALKDSSGNEITPELAKHNLDAAKKELKIAKMGIEEAKNQGIIATEEYQR